jgi:hypothetical protein
MPTVRRLAGLAAATAALLLPAAAHAADSHAPRGARGDWLPSSEWVMSGWLPYDQARLDALLQTDRSQLSVWLDDKRSLMDLARSRGFHDSHALAVRLVATRHVGPAVRRALVRRAQDTLTQPHLARHVLFHVFHTSALAPAAPQVFGVRPQTFVRLRNSGLTPVDIAHRGGRTRAQLGAALGRFFAARAHRGVRTASMSGAQAQVLLAEQTAGQPTFVCRHYRTPQQQAAFAARPHRFQPDATTLAGMP